MSTPRTRVEHAFERLSRAHFDERHVPFVYLGRDYDLDEVCLGRGPSGTYRLWIRSPEHRVGPRIDAGSILTTTWDVHPKGRDRDAHSLMVSCEDPRLNRTFMSLIAEMLENVEGSPGLVLDAFLNVLESWHEILTSRKKEMDRETAIGLFGELTVLLRLARTESPDPLGCWRGTENYRHDFNRTNSVEVKTYTGFGEPRVQIHGAHQLEPPTGHDLNLVALKIDENRSGRSLADLVDEIAVLGVPRGAILRRIGLSMEELEKVDLCFVVEDIHVYEVGEGFPGIRPSQLRDGALAGVDRLTYSLSLDQCRAWRVPEEKLDQILEAL